MNITTATASSIIDRAILLKEGGVIVIPCSSYEEMEGLRSRLYKLRNQLAKKHSSLAMSLDITRKVKGKKWTLYVSKEKTLLGVLIIEDGKAEPFSIEVNEETAGERRERLMAEDGTEVTQKCSEPQELPEPKEDFDEVAAKIEEAQDLHWEERENEETSK